MVTKPMPPGKEFTKALSTLEKTESSKPCKKCKGEHRYEEVDIPKNKSKSAEPQKTNHEKEKEPKFDATDVFLVLLVWGSILTVAIIGSLLL